MAISLKRQPSRAGLSPQYPVGGQPTQISEWVSYLKSFDKLNHLAPGSIYTFAHQTIKT